MGAVMGAVFSIVAAISISLLSDYQIASDNGIANDLETFKYQNIEEGTLKTALTSYAYRCNDLIEYDAENIQQLDLDFSKLDGFDYSDLSFNKPSIQFENDSSDIPYKVNMTSVAEMHNDILRCMIQNGVPSLNINNALNIMGLNELKADAYYNSIESSLECFIEAGNSWINDSTYTLVEDVHTGIYSNIINNCDDIINKTVNSYIEGVIKICKSNTSDWDYYINRLTDNYVSYINKQVFMPTEVKHIVFSSIGVGAYSSRFWQQESGIIK